MSDRPPGGRRSFGEVIRDLRLQRGLSLSETVETVRRRRPQIRLSSSSLSRLERGEGRWAEPRLLRELARLFGVSYPTLARLMLECVYGVDCDAHTEPHRDEALAPPLDEGPGVDPAIGGDEAVSDPPALSEVMRGLNPDGQDLLARLAEALARDARFRRR